MRIKSIAKKAVKDYLQEFDTLADLIDLESWTPSVAEWFMYYAEEENVDPELFEDAVFDILIDRYDSFLSQNLKRLRRKFKEDWCALVFKSRGETYEICDSEEDAILWVFEYLGVEEARRSDNWVVLPVVEAVQKYPDCFRDLCY